MSANQKSRIKNKLAILAAVHLLVSANAFSEGDKNADQVSDIPDAATQEAYTKTQSLLQNPDAREAAAQETPAAKASDAYVKMLSGNDPAATQKIYDLAASVFEIIVREGKGDPEKMQALVGDYHKNPEAFAKKFSPEQKSQLRDISSKMPQPLSNK
jgi:NAD-dependent oxidoreductase involved in siderophore biosynthesis